MDPFERNRIGNGHPTVFRLVARLVSQKMIFGSHDHTTTSVMILCQQSVLVTLWTKPVYVANIWRTNPSMEKVNQHSCTHGTQIRSTHPPPEFVCKSIDRTTKWSLKMGIFALFNYFFLTQFAFSIKVLTELPNETWRWKYLHVFNSLFLTQFAFSVRFSFKPVSPAVRFGSNTGSNRRHSLLRDGLALMQIIPI